MRISGAVTGAVFAVTMAITGGPMASKANASPIPYPEVGQVNLQVYSLVATKTGDLNVWFGGKGTAGNDDVLTVLVNGAAIGIVGLDNQTSTLGQLLDFGHINAGDSIIFEMKDLSTGQNWFTDNAKNSDGINHAYMTPFAGGLVGSTVVPAGLYFGFEDVTNCKSDLNYQDLQFYTSSVGAVPEPSTWAMMILGFAGIATLAFRQRRKSMFLQPIV